MSISRNAAYNFIGNVLPIAVTLLTVPLYLQTVGIDRYGALTVCWIILGYLGFLDLGVGRAVSQKIASLRDSDEEAARFFWAGVWISATMGLVGFGICWLGAMLYSSLASGTGTAFEQEIADAVPVIGIILPIVLTSSVAAGALSAKERFLALNAVTMVSSTLMAILPLLVAFLWAPTLLALVVGASMARVIGLILMFGRACAVLPVAAPRAPTFDRIVPLLKFGGWITISSAAAPLLLTVDRLAIGATLGPAAVAAYSIPFSLVSRLSIIPSSLAGALFPRFASTDAAEHKRLLHLSLAVIAVVMTPAAVAVVALADPFFRLWIGADLAQVSSPVAYALVVGSWMNSFAFMPYSMLQGSGRPEAVSKILLWELIPYWFLLWIGLTTAGLTGAAIASALRMTADSALLFAAAGTRPRDFRPLLAPALLLMAAVAIAIGLDGAERYGAHGALFILTVGWAIRAMPEPLRVGYRSIGFLRLRSGKKKPSEATAREGS